jgi:hypothetical protein
MAEPVDGLWTHGKVCLDMHQVTFRVRDMRERLGLNSQVAVQFSSDTEGQCSELYHCSSSRRANVGSISRVPRNYSRWAGEAIVCLILGLNFEEWAALHG